MIAPAFFPTIEVKDDSVERFACVVRKLQEEKTAGDQRAAAALRVLTAYPARMEGVAYPGRLMDGPADKPFLFFLGGPVVLVDWSVS